MQYDIIYDRLIDKAKCRKLGIGAYKEAHHIVPKCVGGCDSRENIVYLTPEEHYVAHQLLVKMKRFSGHPGYNGLIYATNMMCVGGAKRSSNKAYGWVKRRFAEVHSDRMTGHKQSPETIAKRVSKILGKTRSTEQRERIANAKRGVPRKPFSEKAISNMIAAQAKVREREKEEGRVRQFSEKTKYKMREAKKGYRPSPLAMEKARVAASQPRSETVKKRMSEAGIKAWANRTQEQRLHHKESLRGRKLSQETKDKIRDAAKGRKPSRESIERGVEARKKIAILKLREIYTQIIEMLGEGRSQAKIAAALQISAGSVSYCNKNKVYIQKVFKEADAVKE